MPKNHLLSSISAQDKKFFKRARFLDAVALERDVDAFCATLHVNNEHSQFKL